MLQITPTVRNEVRIRASDGTKFPVGVPFKFDGKIDDLREMLPGREIETVAASDTPGEIVSPDDNTNTGDDPEKGE